MGGGLVMIDPRQPASLSAADVLRVSAAVRFAERFDRARGNGAGRAPGGTNPDGPAVWPLKVTGTSGGGFQPARLQFWPGATSLADLADARAGTLATRTGDDAGTVTFGAGHGFVTGDLVELKWAGGERREMSATVAGVAVTLDGGTGDALPVETTAVTATKDDAWILLVGSQTFEPGDRPLGLVVGMKEDGRPVLVAVAAGTGGAGTGLTVQAADGDPSFTGTTTLEFNEEDGFVLSQPAPGVSHVGLSVANSVLSRLCVVKDGDGFVTDLQYVNEAGACVTLPECADTEGGCGPVPFSCFTFSCAETPRRLYATFSNPTGACVGALPADPIALDYSIAPGFGNGWWAENGTLLPSAPGCGNGPLPLGFYCVLGGGWQWITPSGTRVEVSCDPFHLRFTGVPGTFLCDCDTPGTYDVDITE